MLRYFNQEHDRENEELGEILALAGNGVNSISRVQRSLVSMAHQIATSID